MNKFHKFLISLILLKLGSIMPLLAAESVMQIYLSADEASTPLIAVEEGSSDLTEVKPVMDEQLSAQGWKTATWSGTLKGYALEGSSTKQLTLPAGTMVYQKPSLESTVITMVDNDDERNENFHIVGVENDWEMVEFKKPMQVYVKIASESGEPESRALAETSEGSSMQEGGVPSQLSMKDSAGENVVDLGNANNTIMVSSDDASAQIKHKLGDQTEGNAAEDYFEDDTQVVEAVELPLDDAARGDDVSIGELQEPIVHKKALPPIDKDPLVRRCPAPAASAIRQLSGKLVKSSLLCNIMEKNYYQLMDESNRTLAYLDLSGVNNICHYLNRSVVVQGPVSCKRPSAPLTMKVKLIRIVR